MVTNNLSSVICYLIVSWGKWTASELIILHLITWHHPVLGMILSHKVLIIKDLQVNIS